MVSPEGLCSSLVTLPSLRRPHRHTLRARPERPGKRVTRTPDDRHRAPVPAVPPDPLGRDVREEWRAEVT